VGTKFYRDLRTAELEDANTFGRIGNSGCNFVPNSEDSLNILEL
jgi:hypothetical protein